MTTHEYPWHQPRPPIEPPIQPFEELPPDPTHPTFDGTARLFIERHHHTLHHDQTDEWQQVTATAVLVPDGLTGERIEFGPWSLSPEEARSLAASLTWLAADVTRGRS